MGNRRTQYLIPLTLCVAFWQSFAQAQVDPANPIGKFDIARFEVDGNTLLSPEAISAAVSGFSGTARDFSHVQQALEALEAEYHRRGYNVVQVVLPEQELNKGVVHLRVIETRLGKVTLEGNSHYSDANIIRSLPSLKVGASPNVAAISRELKLANESGAKKVNLQLQSSTQDDAVNATLKVTDEKPWNIGASVDNTGDSASGRNHLTLVYQNQNLFDLDHSLSLQYTTSLEKPGSVHVYGVGYHVPLYSLGDSLDVFGSYSDVDSGSVTAGPFDLAVSGKGSVFGTRYNHNFERRGDYESRLIYGFDYKAYKNSVVLGLAQLGNDITVHPVSLTYSGNWNTGRGEANYFVTLAHNISGGDNGGADAFAKTRLNAKSGYTTIHIGGGVTRFFEQGWQIHASLAAQWTPDALIPGEQFGLGGAATVRGYHEREVANDKGVLGNLELFTPNICVGQNGAQCRFLAFYDVGHAWRNDALPGELTQSTLASIGLGMRFSLARYLAMQFDYARALDATEVTAKGDRRVHVRMGLTY